MRMQASTTDRKEKKEDGDAVARKCAVRGSRAAVDEGRRTGEALRRAKAERVNIG